MADAKAPAPVAVPDGHKKCRVLKAGDGKIYTGEIVKDVFETFKKGDEFIAPDAQAGELEDRGLVET